MKDETPGEGVCKQIYLKKNPALSFGGAVKKGKEPTSIFILTDSAKFLNLPSDKGFIAAVMIWSKNKKEICTVHMLGTGDST